MNKLIITLSIWQILIISTEQLSLPRDAEMLDGYKMAPIDQINPEGDGPFTGEQLDMNIMPIRDRRSPRYKVMESPGLRSHFHIDAEELKRSLERSRNRRELEDADKTRRELRSDEIEVEDEDELPKRRSDVEDVSLEELPVAEKHTLNPSYYRTDEDRLMEKWVKSPYESRSHKDDPADSQPEASSNVGINARQPRVNFITQQGQSSNNKDIPEGPEARDQNRDQTQNNKQSQDDSYRKPNQDRYYPTNYGNADRNNYVQDYYPQQGQYNPYWDRNNYYPATNRDRDRYYDDRYDRDRLYDRHYDMFMRPPPGMGSMQPPSYSNGYYYRHQYNDYDEYYPRNIPSSYYSDKRFDVPPVAGPPVEAREPPGAYSNYRPYLHTNDVSGSERYPPLVPGNSQGTGRIIYYAHLPEITRPPPVYPAAAAPHNRYGTVAKRYDPSYDYYYNNNYDRRGAADDYRNGRLSRMVKSTPIRESEAITKESTATTRVSSAPLHAVRPFERYSFQDGLDSYPHPLYNRRYDD